MGKKTKKDISEETDDLPEDEPLEEGLEDLPEEDLPEEEDLEGEDDIEDEEEDDIEDEEEDDIEDEEEDDIEDEEEDDIEDEEEDDIEDEEEKTSKSRRPSKAKDEPSSSMKIMALVVVTIILIAIPLTYIVMKGDDGDDDDDGGDDGGDGGGGSTPGFELSIGGTDSGTTLTYDDIKDLDTLTGTASYQNSYGNWNDPAEYTGVTMGALADHLGGMEPGDMMTVTATDEYAQNYCYYQIYPQGKYLEHQGNMILAYEKDGETVPDWGDGPMIVVLAPDGEFSNEDLNQTAPKDPQFGATTSAGSLFVKNIAGMSVNRQVFTEWSFNLTGADNDTTVIDRTEFVRLAFYSSGEFTDDDGVWTGVPIQDILGIVDDDDPYSFNRELADAGYDVEFTADDGYAKTHAVGDLLAGNALIADLMNNTPIVGKHQPLRLVGGGLSSGAMVGAISDIRIIGGGGPTGPVVLTLQGESVIDLTMDQLKAMPSITGSASFIKSTGTIEGPFSYKGVLVSDLVDMMFSGEDYSLEVVASDGYTMVYTPSQVEGQFATYVGEDVILRDDLSMILAYEEIGKPELEGGPLRVVIVADDEPLTDGHFWAKYVRTMRIVGMVTDWTINLTGVEDYLMDRSTFESLASCEYHHTNYTDGENTYSGIPLWILVSAMDGADAPDGHFMFNEVLAEAGYNVTVVAGDGYSATFHSSQVTRNASILVAHRMNGDPLPQGAQPLQIVGPGLSGKQKIKNIAEVRMEDIPDMANWTIELKGAVDMDFDAAQFGALFGCGHHNVEFNDTDKGVVYEGIPLYIFVGAVDDVDTDHYTLNDTLVVLGYTVNVTAADGFFVHFPIEQVAYNQSILLAYTEDGEVLTGEHPIKIVGPGLDGKQKIKDIVSITLEGMPDTSPKWNITLDGLREVEYTSDDFAGLYDSGEYNVWHNYTKDTVDYHYGGVPLWVMVAIVDGEEDDGYTLNQTMVDLGYMVNVTAADGFFALFPISMVAGNDSMVVAYTLDGEVMTGDHPLRLTGEELSGKQKIRDILSISLQEFNWNITVKGNVTEVMTREDIDDMYQSGDNIGYHNYTKDDKDYHYAGIPLWVLLGLVDDTDGDPDLNDSQVAEGYSIKITAADGFEVTLDIEQVAYNNSIIIAYALDGEPMDGLHPLRLTGEGLTGSQKVRDIVSIEIVEG